MVARRFLLFLVSFVVSEATTKTPAQLIDELRQKQLNGMVAEQEEFLLLNVPAQLAKAAFFEAEKRKLQAESDVFEINATPYSPFDAEKSPKNLGYLGRGYDVLFGNPLDDSGRLDPGFRLPVIQLEYLQNVFSADGEHRMPDNADVIMEPSALFSSSYSDVRTESDYKEELSKEVKTTAGFSIGVKGVFSASGEFSQSNSYKSAKQNIENGGKVNIDIIGRATVYTAKLNVLAKNTMIATKVLQNIIKDLPVLSDQCPDQEMSPFYELIQNYGTHFTTVVTMGAKSVQRLTMTVSESMELKKKGISTSQVVSTSLGATVKGVTVEANFGREEKSDKETLISDTLKNMNIQKTEFYIGGESPSESSSDQGDQGSTNSLLEWGRSASEQPVPIQYEIRKIADVFANIHLPDVDDDEATIASKKTCMLKALANYCSKVAADREDCVAYDDGTGSTDVIRYGHLIRIKTGVTTGAKYLNVPETPPKFGTGNIAQYIKVVPVDPTVYWKYGKALHYGEPFNLVTEHGGEQVMKLCGSGNQERWNFFNFGQEPMECEGGDNAIGQWTIQKDHVCPDAILLTTAVSAKGCQEYCIQETDGACQIILDLIGTACYRCPDASTIQRFAGSAGVYNIYRRENPSQKIPIKPETIATMYFTSPLGKKQGDLVTRNDKVYIGISSYGEMKPLYDVSRRTFLKQRGGSDVEVKEDEVATAAININACTATDERPKAQHAKDCTYWWKVESDDKKLRTYPNAHYA